MQHNPTATAIAAATLTLFLLTTPTTANNITKILEKYPQFSIFNHYLTVTHLAADINSRQTITVCVVEDKDMSDLLSKNLPINTIQNILSLHVLLDYYGAKKLHEITNGTALAATLYQATGSAPGASGFVNITDFKAGKVGFSAVDSPTTDAFFVKSVDEIPYNLSVIQISQILQSAEASAPTPSPAEMNLTSLMSKQGCKVFADTLSNSSDALKAFEDNIEGGLSVFCPADDVFKQFLPKFKNLTADEQTSLLCYHGIPVYQSMSMLKSNNGVMNTLATDGANKFDFVVQNDGQDITLQTKIVTAKITGTLVDEDPLVVYTVDKVLLPKELFKAEAPTPAPAPAPAAAPPKKSKSGKGKGNYASPPQPESPDSQPSDQVADQKGDAGFNGGRFVAAVALSLWLGLLSP
ncbi:FAS1 domain [Dillenia turbinata]|uniref:FAS1 domain n=1 Tax=Dillenia turbinata TaxID=194707 RepID=A0AAN8ZBT8_9MAGN